MSATTRRRTFLLAAVLAATSAAVSAQAAEKHSGSAEKCYGIAKAGENSCAASNGSHSCAGLARTAYSGQEFKDTPVGTCTEMNGALKPFDGVNPKFKG